MINRIREGNLLIAETLHELIETEILPGSDVSAATFWIGLNNLVGMFAEKNSALLQRRNDLQSAIDDWHQHHDFSLSPYKRFLEKIGYLAPEHGPFTIDTCNVDAEVSCIAGPQLIVPVSNERYALNAANARWGSLYDALYGTNVIPEVNGCERDSQYNPKRGNAVVSFASMFLDRTFPLEEANYGDVVEFTVAASESHGGDSLLARTRNGRTVSLQNGDQFLGYKEDSDSHLNVVLLRNNDLHVELQFDRSDPIGAESLSGLKDVILEAAVTTIQDCEDSVAAVDAEDKCAVYRNWLGLMQGTLSTTFQKSGKAIARALNSDREYTGVDRGKFSLPGRSLLLIRNVGFLMTTSAVTDLEGNEIPEGILDALVTSACALHDLKGTSKFKNSAAKSIYVVMPKMHGPEEAAFADELFTFVEEVLGLDRYTVKIGLMDEERRTTVNLKECIGAIKNRIFFINTGFLDRTGDEIHTCMEAGAVLPKGDIKNQPWIKSYEDRNVDIGLQCGFSRRAQIGKGMWAMPDEMKAMVDSKLAHPQAGANCAWVPSPTAATLHALHYHATNVDLRQRELAKRPLTGLDDILTPPLLGSREITTGEIQCELDNNVQGILGYVVRWIQQGIGCSKIPDINNVGLMEDRATLRISSQHIANWLRHGIVSERQVRDTLLRMSAVVDRQNEGDPHYQQLSRDPDNSVAFQAACDLVFLGRAQPNGYTELLLHSRRREEKAKNQS